MAVIQIKSLTKHFGPLHALEAVSPDVQAGEIYGLLGLNGAGKTTLIRLLLSIIRPSLGTVWVLGKAVGSSPAIWNQVGYLVETPQAYPNLSVEENLKVYSGYRNLIIKKAAPRSALSRFVNCSRNRPVMERPSCFPVIC